MNVKNLLIEIACDISAVVLYGLYLFGMVVLGAVFIFVEKLDQLISRLRR